MRHTRITFNTEDKKTKKIGKTICLVFDTKAVYRFDSQEQTNVTFNKMQKDGKKVLYSRGMIYQLFPNKNMKQIVEILREDAKKGAENTQGTKAEIIIKNWRETLK